MYPSIMMVLAKLCAAVTLLACQVLSHHVPSTEEDSLPVLQHRLGTDGAGFAGAHLLLLGEPGQAILRAALTGPEPTARVVAARVLARSGEMPLVRAVARALPFQHEDNRFDLINELLAAGNQGIEALRTEALLETDEKQSKIVEALLYFGPKASLAMLDIAKRANPRARALAIRFFEAYDNDQGRAIIQESLRDKSPIVRAQAYRYFGHRSRKDANAAAIVERGLDDPSMPVRVAAALGMAHRKPGTVPILVQGATSSDQSLASEALSNLSDFIMSRDPNAYVAAFEGLQRIMARAEAKISSRAAYYASNWNYPNSKTYFSVFAPKPKIAQDLNNRMMHLYESPATRMRLWSLYRKTKDFNALFALAAMRDQQTLHPLEAGALGANAYVNEQAIQALGWLGDPRGGEFLVLLGSKSSGSGVVKAIAGAIADLLYAPGELLLRSWLADRAKPDDVRETVGRALAKLPSLAGLELIVKVLRDSDESLRMRGNLLFALASWPCEESFAVASEYLNRPENSQVKWQAALVLGVLRDPRAIPILEPLTRSGDQTLESVSRTALETIKKAPRRVAASAADLVGSPETSRR